MSFALNHTDISLGITSDLSSALTIDLIPVQMPVITTLSGAVMQAAFSSIDSDSLLSRIIALVKPLIEKQLTEKTIDFSVTPVFWLLPELAIEDNQPLINWAGLLKQYFPMLFDHPKTQFFPYGSSSIVMALKTAESLLMNKNVQQVCFIAVDSLYHELDQLLFNDICLTQSNSEGLIPSEGAVMTCISLSNEGINLLVADSERATSHQVSKSIGSLFHTVTRQLKQQHHNSLISSFYTPSNGLTKNTTPWLDAYQGLAGHVNQETKFKQLSLLTGDLGCVSGLYQFLHIYHAYQHQYITGNTLQLEMSERLYQAVNLYSWTDKGTV